MSSKSWAYVVVALLCVAAGVLAAGFSGLEAKNPTITAPPTTERTLAVPATEQSGGSDGAVPLSDLPTRAEVTVVVANGTDIGALAAATVDFLEQNGYAEVVDTEGTELAAVTTVYFVEGSESSAVRLAGDLFLPPTSVAPIEIAPDVGVDLDGVELLAYLGDDQA